MTEIRKIYQTSTQQRMILALKRPILRSRSLRLLMSWVMQCCREKYFELVALKKQKLGFKISMFFSRPETSSSSINGHNPYQGLSALAQN